MSPTTKAVPDPATQADDATEPTQATPAPDDGEPDGDAEQPRKTRGRKPSAARKTRTVELTLTLTGTAEGEWQAELSQHGNWVVQGLAIPAASVSRAAAELHEDIAKAIDSVLDAARQQHRARLDELEAELNKVKQALAELEES